MDGRSVCKTEENLNNGIPYDIIAL